MAEPRRLTKRERGEAIGILKNEVALMQAFGEKYLECDNEHFRKVAERGVRKADLLAKVIAWLEGADAR